MCRSNKEPVRVANDKERPKCPKCSKHMEFNEYEGYYNTYSGWEFACTCFDKIEYGPDNSEYWGYN